MNYIQLTCFTQLLEDNEDSIPAVKNSVSRSGE